MVFECDGEKFDTNDMLAPEIRDQYVISVYITPDYRCVFGVFSFPDSGIVIQRITGESLRNLALRTKNDELARAVGAGAVEKSA